MTLLSRRRKLILVLGNGAAGAEKQALALASKVQAYLPTEENVSVAMSRVPYSSRFFARLPPIAHVLFARSTNNPWIGYAHPLPNEAPDIVIGCGRSTVALCAGLKQAFPQVFNIQIQHPRTFLYHFDAIITPQHDFPSCPPPQNVYLTPGTICDISPKSLASARQQWRHSVEESWASYPHRKIAVLIGGSCRGYSLTLERAQHLVQHLQKVGATAPITLLVTFSRRTPHDVLRLPSSWLQHALS
ncbi:hypothetical protein Ae201684P_013909 [Aphanomyces euteiches]|nr:hypothetical protein Ae201684P_013909 [Aphanomyces euteiches]